MPYDDVYAMATPGRVFDMFTNQAHALRSAGPRRPGGSLMLFAGARHAAALLCEDDETIVARFLADLHELYPQTRGVVAGATVQRWELGNVYAPPRARAVSSPRSRARSAPTPTSTSPATTSPSWGTSKPPPAPGSRPQNASTPRLREVTHA